MSNNGIPRLSVSEVAQIVDLAYEDSGSDLLALGVGQAKAFHSVDQEVGRLFANHMSNLSREAFPWSAVHTAPEWGALFNTFLKDSSCATGPVILYGSDGVEIQLNTVVQIGVVQYRVTAEKTIVGGEVSLDVIALSPGLSGNFVEGTVVNLVTPIAGVDVSGVVGPGGLVGGADTEELVPFRDRTVASLRVAPGGGNDDDYVRWSLEVPGVTRAWTDAHGNGDGTVVVRFMMDETYANGIPTEADEQAVLNYLRRHWDDSLGRFIGYPVHMDGKVYAWAPVAKPLNFEISGLDPVTEAVKAAISAQLKDLIRREGSPGAAIHPSWCWEAISLATGERKHVLTFPTDPFTTQRGEIVTFGGVSYAAT